MSLPTEQFNIEEEKYYLRECEINGKRQAYHACSSRSLGKSIDFYQDTHEYIGSSTKWWINGVNYDDGTIMHFFVKK